MSAGAGVLEAALIAHLRRVTETTAPPFHEGRRGELVARSWRDAGLAVTRDDVGNVIASVPGGTGPRVLVAAHLDTVFGPEVEVRVVERAGRLCAPGIGDNSASLALLLHLAGELVHGDELARPRLTLAATVGEEGLGDLRGARRLVERHAADHDHFVALDGHLGTIVAQAVGSRRFEVHLSGAGGHSWGDFPSPSAVHAAAEAIHAVLRLAVPKEPRTTLNVGQVWGGTSINAIAERAGFNLDVRSVDADVLAALADAAVAAARRAARRLGCEVSVEGVGERPAARTDNERLVACAREALAAVGEGARVVASSTDANAAMAAGLSAIAFGAYRGGDAHRESEWLEPASLVRGYRAFLRLLELLSGL